MANKLIPEELQTLIDQYLTDGVLTDKERAVILKKAEGMGLDRDEIDLYLDAEVQKIDQATDAVVRRQKSKSCPYCGAPVPQLTDKCPECGQFITPEASEELQDILEHLEAALVDFKSGKDLDYNKATVERYARKAKMYFSNNPKIKLLLDEVETEMVEAEKKLKDQQRYKNTKDFLTNPWTYGGLFIILTLLVIVFFVYKTAVTAEQGGGDDAVMWGLGIFYMGVPCIVGTVFFIKKVCLKL